MAIAATMEALVMRVIADIWMSTSAQSIRCFFSHVAGCAIQSYIRWAVGLLLSTLSLSVFAQNHAVIVSGLGGNTQYTESFRASAIAFTEALQSLDQGQDTVVYLDDTASRETILNAIRTAGALMGSTSSPSPVFSLVLIGHGTANSSTWQFNLRGPDLTTEDLIAALNENPSTQQLIILAASASGAALEALAQPQRVVITATKSGGEINAVRFPEYLAEAVASDVADYNRNEILTAAEMFRFAQAKTGRYYEQQKLLATEHARLEGNGAADIAVALLGSLKEAYSDPIVAELLKNRLALEIAFNQLKSKKSEMLVGEYYADLETLLISIAQLQQSIDAATGWSDTDADS